MLVTVKDFKLSVSWSKGSNIPYTNWMCVHVHVGETEWDSRQRKREREGGGKWERER